MSPLSAATGKAHALVASANTPASDRRVCRRADETSSSISHAAGKVTPLTGLRVRPWKVLHACNGSGYETVNSLLEAQAALGMCPALVMPDGPLSEAAMEDGSVRRAASLSGAWNSVRSWRRALLENGAPGYEIVHAHCFPAAMAAVRNFPVVVYELERFIEDDLAGNSATNNKWKRFWIRRPLCAAERFVLSRAAAIVVRADSVRQALLRRGAHAEHVFVIPRALQSSVFDAPEAPGRSRAGGTFAVFSSIAAGMEWRGWMRQLFQALNSARRETSGLALYLQANASLRQEALRYAASFELGFEVQFVDEAAAEESLAECSLVVIGAADQPGVTPVENPLALAALRLGKPLLAADLPCNRDVTPRGCGCLWFHPADAADLAKRISFLVSNEAFRSSLAGSGARYLRDSRDPLRLAEQYDAVYRHASARRHSGNLRTQVVRWQPMQACI